MDNARHSDDFEHAIIVCWWTEFVIFLVSPQIGTAGPTEKRQEHSEFSFWLLAQFLLPENIHDHNAF